MHNIHKDHPMVPEKIKIKEEWLSPCSLENANKFNIKTGGIHKLAPNLMSKKELCCSLQKLEILFIKSINI